MVDRTQRFADPMDAHRTEIDKRVADWRDQRFQDTEKMPSGRETMEYRKYVESQFLGLGDLISRYVDVARKGDLGMRDADRRNASVAPRRAQPPLRGHGCRDFDGLHRHYRCALGGGGLRAPQSILPPTSHVAHDGSFGD